MAKILMEEYEEYPVLPADSIIQVKVEDCSVKEVNGQRGTWNKLEFTFKIMSVPSPEYDSLITGKIWGSVPFRFTDSVENKLRQWVEALLGMELSAGFELDTDLLIGREARAIISNYDKKATDPRTGLPFKQHQVDTLLPKTGGPLTAADLRTQPSQPQPTPVAAGGGWDDPPPF